jgi:PadR family transcriptional regulator, regulatory protein PadR
MDSWKIAAQMKKGILEYIILSIISKGEVYASDIIDTLKKNDLIVVEGTLYPLLSRLRTEELLNYARVESVQWPPRKYYTLTDKWQESLTKMRTAWKAMVKTIHNVDPLSK